MEEGQINPIPLTFFMVLLLLHRNAEKRASQMEENKARYIYFKRAVGNFAIYNTGLGGQSEVTLWTAEGRG